jgi:spore germination protein KB
MPQNKFEKGKIIPWQLAMLIIGFQLGEPILLPIGGVAGHDVWISYFLSLVEVLLLVLVYMKLALRFQGKNLVEICTIVYGRYLGKLIAIMYIWFFFHLGSLILAVFSHFFNITTYQQTPGIVFIIFIVVVCALAVKNGIEVIACCGQILVPLVIGIAFLDTALLFKDWDLGNFLPVFEKPLSQILLAAQEIVSLPLGQSVVFFMIFPLLTNPKKIAKPFTTALLFSWLVLLLFAIRDIAVLGPSAAIYTYPSFQSLRLVNIFNFVTRLEIFTTFSFLMTGFVKVATAFYGAVLGTAQVLGLKTYRVLIIPVGILMIILATLNFSNISDLNDGAKIAWPIYSLPFEIGIPFLTLIIAMIRKLPKGES